MTTRANYARQLGQSFAGQRDVYQEAGYPLHITPEQYLGKATRQDIASRILDVFPAETWRKPPVVLDGTSEEDSSEDTPFVKAWQAIANPPPTFDLDSDNKSIWHYLKRADKLSLMGRYGVLFLGLSGDDKLTDQLTRNGHALAYLKPYSERLAEFTDSDLVKDTDSNRFGQPKRYRIQLAPGITRNVNWSRCIHIAENLLEDDLYGEPILKAVWNRLDDLEQVMAGSKEAFWQFVGRAAVFKREQDSTGDDLSEEDLYNFFHSLRKTIEVEGYDVSMLSGESVDPSAVVKVIMTTIAATLGIPQRVLMGSESGQLASGQDDDHWLDQIRSRQLLHAQPNILEPLINRLVFAGALPMPTSGNYCIKWPNLADSSPAQEAEIFSSVADGFKSLSEGQVERYVDVAGLVGDLLPSVNPDHINDEITPLDTTAIQANVRSGTRPPVPAGDARIDVEDADEAVDAWDKGVPDLLGILDAE